MRTYGQALDALARRLASARALKAALSVYAKDSLDDEDTFQAQFATCYAEDLHAQIGALTRRVTLLRSRP